MSRISTWLHGSGLTDVLGKVWGSTMFQDAFANVLQGIADKGKAAINDPAKLKVLFDNIEKHPDAIIGAVVVGTPAEKLVSKEVVAAAANVLDKPVPPPAQAAGSTGSGAGQQAETSRPSGKPAGT